MCQKSSRLTSQRNAEECAANYWCVVYVHKPVQQQRKGDVSWCLVLVDEFGNMMMIITHLGAAGETL